MYVELLCVCVCVCVCVMGCFSLGLEIFPTLWNVVYHCTCPVHFNLFATS